MDMAAEVLKDEETRWGRSDEEAVKMVGERRGRNAERAQLTSMSCTARSEGGGELERAAAHK